MIKGGSAYHHPRQSDVGEIMLVISTADVGMSTCPKMRYQPLREEQMKRAKRTSEPTLCNGRKLWVNLRCSWLNADVPASMSVHDGHQRRFAQVLCSSTNGSESVRIHTNKKRLTKSFLISFKARAWYALSTWAPRCLSRNPKSFDCSPSLKRNSSSGKPRAPTVSQTPRHLTMAKPSKQKIGKWCI